ncbi:hypothetical protein L873DRAFT_1798337 [Choiromyces venosus 120613-1]|uniref:Uncharacterized protein n=1 Tax=Choiromyces venosus 120613-1 TaxID=1336337 RepID=A0A3N4K7S8_9PEZI|nr:hypothetical protein L873DRAFT_1798337 [Choiromyces venosus 120613-1]
MGEKITVNEGMIFILRVISARTCYPATILVYSSAWGTRLKTPEFPFALPCESYGSRSRGGVG